MKTRLRLVLVVLIGLVGLYGTTMPAHAANRRVLIVYDALNPIADGQKKLAGLQQIFTSVGVPTQTEKLSDYYEGQLTTQKYIGVVTLVNWPQGSLRNEAFTRDRQAFKGKRMHIGQGLSAAEARQLHATRRNVYHQQLVLSLGKQAQLLPFSEDITLLQTTNSAKEYGTLRPQSQGIGHYPYGTVMGKTGYLPYFEPNGFSQVLAAQTITRLFGVRQRRLRPMLTITGVTPYSDLPRLTKMADKLNAAGIPFAISTTSVAENTSLAAFSRFSKALRIVENDQGIIFLQVPIVGAANQQSGALLEQNMVEELNQLGQRQVMPVGISAPIY